jgi:hypothetical protein
MRSSSHNSIARMTNGNRKEQKSDWRRQTGKRLANKFGGLNDPIIVQVNRIIQECSACFHSNASMLLILKSTEEVKRYRN